MSFSYRTPHLRRVLRRLVGRNYLDSEQVATDSKRDVPSRENTAFEPTRRNHRYLAPYSSRYSISARLGGEHSALTSMAT